MSNDFFDRYFVSEKESKTDKDYVIVKGNTRFSVLTDRLLRVEYDKNGHFTDEPTQVVWYRSFEKPVYRIECCKSIIKIITCATVFTYNLRTNKMESITLKGGKTVTDYDKGNLKGTYRTLDNTAGKIKLEEGLVSTEGVAYFDDALSLTIKPDGSLAERQKTQKDTYFFAYGHDYRGAVNALFSLCGKVPLVPRYCLGNWWSRYKAYSQQEYIDLIQKFEDEKVPITVATIDMDWHWTNLKRFGDDGKYQFENSPWSIPKALVWGDGWTGYSWNTELFPDYKGFFKWLKDRNYKITLNIHPAQGVRPFEDMYPEFAKGMGLNPEEKKHIHFDITDKKYVENYFECLHKPYENDGVDFWWIDWQQGKNTRLKNLDPLWALNHYHYLYSKKENKRPLILSRYAQIGSHRYPLGFSGDTKINWPCLDFQPYFTANATNVGYTWWSHDIGGHHWGDKDDELYLRWVQFGLYSPIMRLHSTHNEFMGKEPWKFKGEVGRYAIDVLRMRHRMLPYIYSMNYRTYNEGIAICEPMYYTCPDDNGAYKYKNEYFFGSELIVAPVTEKCSPVTNMATVKLWLPKGRYTDIYNGRIYEGEGEFTLCRDITSIPVLAKEGAIIPLSINDRTNDWKNPDKMELLLYRGNGKFSMYEDDGESLDFEKGKYAFTDYEIYENGTTLKLKINKAKGDLSVIPEKRNYLLSFKDIKSCEKITVKTGKKEASVTLNDEAFVSFNIDVRAKEEVEIELLNVVHTANLPKREALVNLISKFQMGNDKKTLLFKKFIENPYTEKFMSGNTDCKNAVDEILNLK